MLAIVWKRLPSVTDDSEHLRNTTLLSTSALDPSLHLQTHKVPSKLKGLFEMTSPGKTQPPEKMFMLGAFLPWHLAVSCLKWLFDWDSWAQNTCRPKIVGEEKTVGSRGNLKRRDIEGPPPLLHVSWQQVGRGALSFPLDTSTKRSILVLNLLVALHLPLPSAHLSNQDAANLLSCTH